MHRFWKAITEPILTTIRPLRLLEIGVDEGRQTRHLLAFCQATGATLHAIDPAPRFDVAAWEEEHRGRFVFHQGLSLNVLPRLDPVDAVLVDGDHNWYTVFHELTLIEAQSRERAHPFPVVLLHDVAWPYGRRDLYYNPDAVPEVFRQPYAIRGLRPGHAELPDQGGLNPHLRHSIYEHNVKNGVLTAIEDYLRSTDQELDFLLVPGFHGMGILVPRHVRSSRPELDALLQQLPVTTALATHVQHIEDARIHLEIERLELRQRIADGEQRATAAEQDVTALKAALETRGSRITELQGRLGEAEQNVKALEAGLEASGSQVAELQARLGDADQLLVRTRGELQALASKLDELRDARDSERRARRAEVERLEADKAAHAVALRERETELAAARADLRARETELAAARADLRERETEVAAARAHANGLEQRLSEGGRTLAQKDRDLARLHGWIEALEANIGDLLGSRRWQIGNRLGELARRLRFQPPTKTAVDALRRTLQRFHDWDVEKTRTPPSSADAPRRGRSAASSRETPDRQPPARLSAHDALDAWQPATVIIPVYDGYDAVTRCLASVERNTPQDACVLVIDDASPDQRIGPLLEQYAAHSSFRVVRNETNLGFVSTVNRGLRETTGDVIILNSDTEVPPHWVRNLRMAAYLHPDVATVTPLSTNAGVFSAPVAHTDNGWPETLAFDDVGRLVARVDDPIYPAVPTGHGFCLYIRRAALDAVGLFDADAFPRGYGEETDFCLRASAAGFTHIVDDRTYVFHARGESFGADRDTLIRSSRAVLDRRYPEYSRLVANLKASPDLARARAKTGRALRQDWRTRPRVLYLLHSGAGGTPQTNLDLMAALKEEYDTYLLTSDGVRLRLFEVVGRQRNTVTSLTLDHPWRITDFTRRDYRTILAELLWRYDIDLVHVRHLMGHPLDAPEVCKRLGVPVVVSFHDFYLVCPTIHLLDDHDRYCGGVCTPGRGTCRIPTGRLRSVPPLKHAWVREWQKGVLAALRHADALVTTSDHTRQVYRSVYDLDIPFHVIDHGRDLRQRTDVAVPPRPGEPIRILAPGNIGVNKGARLFRELKAVDAGGRLDLHFLGDHADILDGLGTDHGTYDREELPERAAAIAPSFVAIFSIWPETYCHTLTEAWSCGIPVLASDIGVLRERIRAHGGGWLLDYTNPADMYRRILEIADDPDEYRREATRATLNGIRSVADMAQDYKQLYGDLLARRFLAARRHLEAPHGTLTPMR